MTLTTATPPRTGTCGHPLSMYSPGPMCWVCQDAEDERQSQYITWAMAVNAFGVSLSKLRSAIASGEVRQFGTMVHVDDVDAIAPHRVIQTDPSNPRRYAYPRCRNGHAQTGENIVPNSRGECRLCVNDRKRARYAERTAAKKDQHARAMQAQRERRAKACLRGHPRTDESTMILANGTRRCLICHEAAIAKHRKKEQCIRGHSMTVANTKIRTDGRTECIACRRDRHREVKQTKRRMSQREWMDQQQGKGVAA